MSAASTGVAVAQRVLDEAEEYRETPEEVVVRLAKLPPLDYERVREKEADALAVRVTVLDAEVAKARPQPVQAKGDGKQGRAVTFREPLPWPEPVNGAELLDALAKAITSFVVMADDAATAVALWSVHTYLLDGFVISPRLAITSPEKRCGKTTLLDVLERLVKRPRNAASLTASVVFRTVEAHQPTLLIDEADTFMAGDDGLRGVLNAGHRRGGTVLRAVGDDFEPREFAVYCAAAIAVIGDLPETLADRSIPVPLKRRRKDEKVEKFRHGRTAQLDVLARRIARWAADNAVAIGAARPAMPVGMHDRAEDNWEPLLAIADLAGGHWPEEARQAARTFAPTDDGDSSVGSELLADIKVIFAERGNPHWLPSEGIVGELGKMEGRRWSEWRNGKPLTQNALARELGKFNTGIEGCYIRPIKRDGKRGYDLTVFQDAFGRYLQPDTPPSPADTVAQPSNRPKPQKPAICALPDAPSVLADAGVQPSNRPKSRDSAVFDDFQPSETEADRTVGIGRKPNESAKTDGWTVEEGEPWAEEI
jgi:putative DNA primase/helicase